MSVRETDAHVRTCRRSHPARRTLPSHPSQSKQSEGSYAARAKESIAANAHWATKHGRDVCKWVKQQQSSSSGAGGGHHSSSGGG